MSFITNGQNIESSNSWDTRLVDINGDCNLDVYFKGKVWLNDGKGYFTDSKLRLGNSNSMAVAVGDINKDTRTDAVTVDVKSDY